MTTGAEQFREAVLDSMVYQPYTNSYKVTWGGKEYADRDTKALVDKVVKDSVVGLSLSMCQVNGCEILASVDIGDDIGRYIMLHNPRNRVHPYVTAWLRHDEPDQWYWGEYYETIAEAKQSLFDRAFMAL